ncbi:PREDICTED: uncharacterized protein LOC109228122 [Nicotiana attenuata]|uniref:uncharacterized protein LOC109228122 n=1 Tax=Nicotiana attenuata TaxID=49451 RepID=UPI0009047965|nr:PREDICTED: uncharacterized protein LOC109228122 [Nicotiana attenuata]
MGSLAHLEAYQRPLAKEVHRLANLGVRLADSSEGGVIVQNTAESSLVVEVKEKQYNDPFIEMAPFKALYGRRCRSPIGWFKIGAAELIGSDLVYQAMEKVKIIKEWMKTSQSWKLSPRYVGPCKIIQRIGQVAYKLELPLEMSLVHPVFHVSILKKVVGDPTLIVSVETIDISEELTYEEILVAILDRQVKEATWQADVEMKKKYPHFLE